MVGRGDATDGNETDRQAHISIATSPPTSPRLSLFWYKTGKSRERTVAYVRAYEPSHPVAWVRFTTDTEQPTPTSALPLELVREPPPPPRRNSNQPIPVEIF